jgi:PAS domain S-box-containing protein
VELAATASTIRTETASWEAPSRAGPLPDALRLVVDAIPGLVWTARPDGHIDFLNRRWLEYTGLTLAQASGWGWQDAIHPADLGGLLAYWRGLLAAGAPGETEARLRRSDGAYRWFLFRGVPFHDAEGRLVKWYGQTTDIEDRKRAETLLEGEKRLLELVATGRPEHEVLEALCRFVEEATPGSHCSILLRDPATGRLATAAAPSLPEGYTRVAHGAVGPCALAAARDEQVISADIAADPRWAGGDWREIALAHGLRACWSTPIRALGGAVLGTFAVSFRTAAQPDAHHRCLIDQLTHIASIAIERGREAEKLRRSEAYLAEAQRLSQTGSFSWRIDDDDIVWSEETYRIYELDPSVKPSMALARSRVHPDDRAIFDEAGRRALAGGSDLRFEHRLLLPPDGRVKHLRVVAHAVRDAAGRAGEFVGAVQDVTDLELREAALHRVRAELAHVGRVSTVGALTASIAHEVNQPLAGIVTNASVVLRLLGGREPDAAGAIEAAQRTIRDANRAAEVIARLRALFRKRSVAKERIDLNEAIEEVLALAASEVQRARAVLRAELARELPPVTGDRTQLQQVVLNLVLNALEAMGGVESGPRQLALATAACEGDAVRVSVSDSGVGIEAQDLERVFGAFYTTKSGGMGMGLAISRSIIESHQGRLFVQPRPGPGATFVFELPRAPSG